MAPRKKTTPTTANGHAITATMELVEADPGKLIVGANVRVDPRVDADLIDSINERGVLEPITAYRDGDGRLVVVRGQRRTMAAVAALRASVPVVVIPRPDDSDRITDQVVENEHRAALATADRAAAYEQLAALGLTAEQIAKRTARPRVEVDAGLAVARSEQARAAAQLQDLTLEEAAVVAEFDGDEKATSQLLEAARRREGFKHVAQRLRDDRADAEAIAAAAEELRQAGVTVVDRPSYGTQMRRLSQLKDVTEERHRSCPGHAAWIDLDYEYPDDDETGPAGDDAEDLDGEDESIGTPVGVPVFVCTDPQGYGHQPIWGTWASAAGQKTEADRAAEAAQRREVIELNKAWDSAEKVRRDWLRQFLGRKTAPKLTSAFVVESLARCDYAISQALSTIGERNAMAYALLGVDVERPGVDDMGQGAGLARLLAGATEARAQVLLLALVLGAYEQYMQRDLWRTVAPWAARYLRYLEGQGYELSDVELRACSAVEPEAADRG